jgi:hypothetical protein
MAYTPNAEDTAQPTGNQALSTAALEFRTLKTYIQATKTAQAVRDDAQDVATAAALVVANAAVSAAAAAALRFSRITTLTGSGNFTVPAGVTHLMVVARGGGCDGHKWRSTTTVSTTSHTFNVLAAAAPEVTAFMQVVAGDIIAYSVGANTVIGESGASHVISTAGAATTFGSVVAPKAVSTGSYCNYINTSQLLLLDQFVVGNTFINYAGTESDAEFPTNFYAINSITENTQEAAMAGSITLLY